MMRSVQLLHQWLSPGFPTGAFAWSHGLDRLIADGEIADGAALEAWLRGVLEYGAGWSDAVLLAQAHRHPARHAEIAELAAALSPTRERHAETTDQGASFARVAGGRPAAYPVAVGALAAREEIELTLTLTLYLQAFAANLVSAAVRAVPLGQAEGQRIVTALLPLCETLAARAAEADLEEAGSCAVRADMASLHHETQYSRMFRS
ncbi:urease accessory protein UreF [Pontivivens ytuae]|uniref:Urease accessory protein UreF n=1 Tax=Pontivivens ytuae TaxID=2789856 RepID=A0A7S9LRI5_9RHOB|nr:urease accessory UreF family protein [Pontivivens ytuae]QPH53923.1 urease accessory protein UreF [Pontivivens ytuae]